mgnify:CR=1 FL=1
MASLSTQLNGIQEQAQLDLGEVKDTRELESWRVAYLGRRGKLTLLLRKLSALALEERRAIGSQANRAKETLEKLLAERQQTHVVNGFDLLFLPFDHHLRPRWFGKGYRQHSSQNAFLKPALISAKFEKIDF